MLSGGEKQRVAIARAIVKNPSIVIADEPTGNLDSKNSLEIMNIIKAISKEKLVILVTHEVDLANFYATRIVEVKDGKAVIITGHLSTYGIVGYNISNPATNSNAEVIVSIILFALMFVGIAFSMKKQEVNA